MQKQLIYTILIVTLAAASPVDSGAQEKDMFFRVGLGAAYPMLDGLSDELEKQGNELPLPQYALGVDLGKLFMDGTFSVEASFSYSMIPNVRYKNDQEDFEENLTHYDFSLIARRRFTRGGKLAPSLGAGLGYGRSNLVSGGGRLESFEFIGSALLEYELGDHLDLFAEAIYVGSFNSGRFDDPHLENVSGDALLNSGGEILEDRYSTFEFRVGLTFWLRTMDRYY